MIKNILVTFIMALGMGASSYCLADTSTESNEDILLDIIGSICEREGFEAMMMKQTGETPEATQQHLNVEVLQPLQQTIESDTNVDANLGGVIVKLSNVFSKIIVKKAWEDNTLILKDRAAQYGTADSLTQQQQDEIWEETKAHALEFAEEMGIMCQSEVYDVLPTLQKK